MIGGLSLKNLRASADACEESEPAPFSRCEHVFFCLSISLARILAGLEKLKKGFFMIY
jgi:hypothetical protein